MPLLHSVVITHMNMDARRERKKEYDTIESDIKNTMKWGKSWDKSFCPGNKKGKIDHLVQQSYSLWLRKMNLTDLLVLDPK